MAVTSDQLLKLLLLLLFVINLPSCQSLCDISAARRDAQTGACHKLNPATRMLRIMARRAANKAEVKLHKVEEAYQQVR